MCSSEGCAAKDGDVVYNEIIDAILTHHNRGNTQKPQRPLMFKVEAKQCLFYFGDTATS